MPTAAGQREVLRLKRPLVLGLRGTARPPPPDVRDFDAQFSKPVSKRDATPTIRSSVCAMHCNSNRLQHVSQRIVLLRADSSVERPMEAPECVGLGMWFVLFFFVLSFSFVSYPLSPPPPLVFSLF